MAAMASIALQLTSIQGLVHKGVGVKRPSNAHPGAPPRRTFVFKSQLHPLVTAHASSTDLAGASDWGEPISLGTVKLPADLNLQRLEVLLYQWGNSLTQNANLPLPVPIKVDKIKGGVRIGYIRLVNGVIEDLAHIDCVVYPGTKGSSAMFRAVRSGRLKNEVPPGEPIIMQSLLQALKKSIDLSSA